MVTKDESDADAVSEVLEVIGGDVINILADVSRKHNVTISLYIAPTGERDPNDDD